MLSFIRNPIFDLTVGKWEPPTTPFMERMWLPLGTGDGNMRLPPTIERCGDDPKELVPNKRSQEATWFMAVLVPSLKGFLSGVDFVSGYGTSLLVADLEEHNWLITYDQATHTAANQATPFGGISDGDLVHITTATDEVLTRPSGRPDWTISLDCYYIYQISLRKILIVSGRDNLPRSTSTAQTNRSGISNISHLGVWRQILG